MHIRFVMLAALLLAFPLLSASLTAGRLSVAIDESTRAYTVSVDGVAWFDSAGDSKGYAYSADGRQYSLADGSLVPLGTPSTGTGSDPAGDYSYTSLSWARNGSTLVEYVTTFKAYQSRSVLVFRQDFPRALAGTAGTTFPSLRQVKVGRLGVLEYCGSSCGFMVGPKGEFPGISGGSGRGYSVIAPLDESGKGTNATLAIGPVLEQFVNQGRNGGDSLCYGVHNSFTFVPAGFAVETSLVAARSSPRPERASVPSGGVNAALFEYGDFQLSRYNKQRAQGNHNRETT